MDELQQLMQYHRWAWQRALEPVKNLNDAQFCAPVVSSFESLRDTLVHCFGADQVWLKRVRAEAQSRPENSLYPNLFDLSEAWFLVLEAWEKQLLAENSGSEMISYTSLKGEPFTSSLKDIVHHVVNHGSYHRGQVATILRQFGQTPASTDMIVWSRISQ